MFLSRAFRVFGAAKTALKPQEQMVKVPPEAISTCTRKRSDDLAQKDGNTRTFENRKSFLSSITKEVATADHAIAPETLNNVVPLVT